MKCIAFTGSPHARRNAAIPLSHARAELKGEPIDTKRSISANHPSRSVGRLSLQGGNSARTERP
jgi:hypothetical protein